MRHFAIILFLLASPALAQAPIDPAQSDWNRLGNESRRMEQEREQRQQQSQQERRFEAERQDLRRQQRNETDQLRMERNQDRRAPQR